MQTFLKLVAHDLHGKFGNDLSRVLLVFPNKRAGLFFNECFVEECDAPVWSPPVMSISELFASLSLEKPGDPMGLVCTLYRVFKAYTGSNEALDDFYDWGELLLKDFDNVDKNLVDAGKLFGNLRDLQSIMGNYAYLDAGQEKAIQQFFLNFSIERQTELKKKFLNLYDKLGGIYADYRAKLSQMGIAYEGMQQRNALNRCIAYPGLFNYDKYVFVGFSYLPKVEHELFKLLRNENKALFYWDYDEYYIHTIPGHEAGEFLKRNLEDFPNELDGRNFHSFQTPKKIRYIAATTENAQARFLSQWAKEFSFGQDDKENAVVLCNESLLLPVLYSIPEEVGRVNITMGYPLAQVPVCDFIMSLLDLQLKGYNTMRGLYQYEYVSRVLKQPFTLRVCKEDALELESRLRKNKLFYLVPDELQINEFLKQVFKPCLSINELCKYLIAVIQDLSMMYKESAAESELFNQLYQEALFQCYKLINRLLDLVQNGGLEVRPETLRGLLMKMIRSTHIPFHGEPAVGLQIMGFLETRNLDFRNILMLGVNEGRMPSTNSEPSMIPYTLRKVFGMTTHEHGNSLYAYYFYRLMQRAENITLLYNAYTDGLHKGEQSRYMLQMLLESGHEISYESLDVKQLPGAITNITQIGKTPRMIWLLCDKYCTADSHAFLSPSAINAYIDCNLKFYYRYIVGLKPADNTKPGDIDPALFGTLFHQSAQNAYETLSNQSTTICRDDLLALMNNKQLLRRFVDKAMKDNHIGSHNQTGAIYNGLQLITIRVIESYLNKLLKNDLEYTPFSIYGMEQSVKDSVDIHVQGGVRRVNVGGYIDRMDLRGNTLRVIDYKTGGNETKAFENLEQVFTPSKDRPHYLFQVFFYSALMARQCGYQISPDLLYIHKANSPTYLKHIGMGAKHQKKTPVEDFRPYAARFYELMIQVLEEMFDFERPFTSTTDTQVCETCDFFGLCKRTYRKKH